MNTLEKNLRIGIFFDGTGNNAQNALKRTNTSLSDKQKGSYQISPTNIYRLFKNYIQTNKQHTKAFYIEGIGTLDHCDDSMTSAATGHDIWEGYSANAKTQKAFESIFSYLEELAIKNYNNPLDITITIDLFGFSRGAALARNFANEIIVKKQIFNQILLSEGHKLTDLNIGFIGLFDTVESIKLSPLNISLNKVQAQGIFHLTALHECRENFPLTSIFTTKNQYANAHRKGAGFHTTKDYFELRVPGAHSDIGGGYNKSENEVKTINLKATYTEKGARQDAQQIREDNPDFQSILDQLHFEFEVKSAGYNTISLRANVNGQLQYVYGQLMLKVAQDYGVPFDNNLYCKNHLIPNDLINFSNILEKQKDQLLAKQAVTIDFDKNVVNFDAILKKYVHISVSTRTVFGKEDSTKQKQIPEPLLKQTVSSNASSTISTKHLMVNRPTPNWQREIKFI